LAALRLGVVDQSPVREGGSAAQAIAETLELARAAERLGYTRYWVAEHHSTPAFAATSPEVLIPRIAAQTEALRVGSGGVMLTHYSALKVAENFRMLEALFPGRIDLGVGRAPGGDLRTARALNAGAGAAGVEEYPRQVADLVGWLDDSLPDEHPFAAVRANPAGPGVPQVWLLGSGGSSARYAAQLGCGYSYAQFISGSDGAAAVQAYRDAFRPSGQFPEPAASVAVSVICADTQAEANRLACTLRLWQRRLMRGVHGAFPSPDDAIRELYGEGAEPPPVRDATRLIAGDPERCHSALLALAERNRVQELLIVTITYDFAARLRSYELLADAFDLA
jgi:luciferase family oxidoreductase group 1